LARGLKGYFLLSALRFMTAYVTPGQQERDKIAYWLKSARLKMTVAKRAGDLLKATFVASTTSWEVLVGLWAVNGKPMPPNSSVWVHLKDLPKRPPDVEAVLKHFFCGEAQQRVQTAIDLIDWILAHLNSGDAHTASP
jgi:hypothetical protein